MSDTVVVTALFRPLPGRKAEALATIHRALAGVHDEAGCRLYAIHEGEGDELLMIEKWDSAAELDAHSTGAPVEVLREGIRGLLSEPVAVTRWAPAPGGDAGKGAL